MSVLKTGSCLCKTVRYRIESEIKGAGNCHCGICKKSSGGPFSSILMLEEAGFKITDGEGVLSSYVVSENATRHFCNLCGSGIYMEHKHFPCMLIVPIGSLDEPAAVAPGMNIFCESMLPWVKNIAALKNFPQAPQG